MTGELGWELGDYSILRTVDSGKFGIVYWAQHKPTGRQAALKLIPLEGADSEEKVAAERHGAMLQQQFSRTHKRMVPEIFEHQPIAMFYAIAMELVHGQPLTDVIAAGPLPPARAAKIALAICRFLAAAHRFETDVEGVHYALIVHGDLKPDHVLLLENDEIRVLDFGIAKALAERTLVTTNKWGSIQYASPERLQSEGHVNEHADFWSLGVMLFEMVAGYRPYHRYEHNASRLDAAIRRQEAPEPLPPDADPVLVAIIRKLLATQIERRYTSAELIVRDLEAYLAGAPTLAATDVAQASVATVRVAPDGTTPIRSPGHPADSDRGGAGAEPVGPDRSAAAHAGDGRDRGDCASDSQAREEAIAFADAGALRRDLCPALDGDARVCRAGSCRPSSGAHRRDRSRPGRGDQVGIPAHRVNGPARSRRRAGTGPAARSHGGARRSRDPRVPNRARPACRRWSGNRHVTASRSRRISRRGPRSRRSARISMRTSCALPRAIERDSKKPSVDFARAPGWIRKHLIPTSASRASMPIRCVRSSRSSTRSRKPNNAAISPGPASRRRLATRIAFAPIALEPPRPASAARSGSNSSPARPKTMANASPILRV